MPLHEATRRQVLVVDDEPSIVNFVRLALEYNGFDVVAASSASEALQAIETSSPHLMVLDVMLPDVDGFTLCRRVRQSGNALPILLLTARGESEDVVRGLDSGADAYLVKPFKMEELVMRVQALLRRSGQHEEGTLVWNDVVLYRTKRQVTVGDRHVNLAPREFMLLEMLMERPNKVHLREEILERVWGNSIQNASILKTCISQLRAKLGDQRRRLLRSVRGIGYTLGG